MVIAPHPDDEILGCGGSIAKHASSGDDVFVVVVTKGEPPIFSEDIVERGRNECREADALLGVRETIFMDFPAVKLEEVARYELNDRFIRMIQTYYPEVVYIPHRGDMQLDHKLTVDAAMVALRPKYEHRVRIIYAYETVSETGWDIPNTTNEFIPNCYNDISEYMDRKIAAMNIFQSQLAEYPNARSIEALRALAIYRGTTVGMKYAEAFSVIREIRD